MVDKVQLQDEDGRSFAKQNSESEPRSGERKNRFACETGTLAQKCFALLALGFSRPSPAAKLKAPHEGVLLILVEVTRNCSFSRKGGYGYPSHHRSEVGDSQDIHRAQVSRFGCRASSREIMCHTIINKKRTPPRFRRS